MISFPCHCSYTFVVDDDQAGGVIQCPKCRRLNDIPTMSDLKQIHDDGTFKLDDIPVEPEPDRLAQLHAAFNRQSDDDGEIDLRPTMDDVRKAGTAEVPHSLRNEVVPGAPKYDPFTGELLQPIDVNVPAEQSVAEIPVAKAVVTYATKELDNVGPLTAFGRLLQPLSLFVIFCLVVTHALLYMSAMTILYGFFLIVPIFLGLGGMILSHYAIIIDEIGPEAKDEVPRPWRQLDWHDDLWGPFYRFAASILFSFFPAAICANLPVHSSLRHMAIFIFFLAGAVVFPPILLIMTTSGTALNVRPDRVMGTLATAPGRFFMMSILFLITLITYVTGLLGTGFLIVHNFLPPPVPPIPLWCSPVIMIPALIGGIFLAHFFAYELGLMYRRFHEQFPWAYQRHIPTRLRDRVTGGLPTPEDYKRKRASVDPRTRLQQLGSDTKNQRRQPES